MHLRAVAAQTLAEVVRDGRSLGDLHAEAEDQLPANQLSAFKHLTFEGCRYWHRYQAVLDQLMDKPLKAKDADLTALLVLGMIALSQDQDADHAAINETVAAVRELKKDWAAKLVNAILRQWQRQQSDPEAPWLEDMRFQSAHPGWITKRLTKDWGEAAAGMLAQNNARAPMTLRVNTQKTTRDAYLALLTAVGISATATVHSPDGISLDTPCPVSELPQFAAGWCSVQDEAAQLAARLLDVAPQHRILDACCAPGGKTCHIAELGGADLMAVDVSPARLKRVSENLTRLGLQAQLATADLSTAAWWDGQTFDRILLDAPCSATGVIRRHPDIKLLRRPTDIAPLVALQRQILAQLWSMLAPNGILVYATCSLFGAENRDNIAWFLSQTPDAEQLPLTASLDETGGQMFPQPHGNDGFFYAKLKKVG
jgi:16S rRNA (cytosine967-C5)-methyltransferase